MDKNSKKYVVVISNDEVAKLKIIEEVKSSQWEIIILEKVAEIIKQTVPIIGFIIEIKTLMKSTPSEKQFINELENSMHFVLLRATFRDNCIYGILTNTHNLESNDPILNFKELCQTQSPKKVRQKERKDAYISLEWAFEKKDENPKNKEWLRSSTANISEGGIFLINTNNENIIIDDRILVKFSEDDHILHGRICWKACWGTSFRHPLGFGVELLGETKTFLEFYQHKIKLLQKW